MRTMGWARFSGGTVPTAVTVTGLAMIAAAWPLRNTSYWSGLLLQVGGTLSLLVPLLLLGRMLERWVERRESRGGIIPSDLSEIPPRIHTGAAELDARGQLTRQHLVDRHQEHERLFILAEREPTQARIRQLLRYTSNIEAIP